MFVERIYSNAVDLARPDETAQVAAQRMHRRKVGSLVVAGPDRRPLGLITDRDLACRVVARGLDAGTIELREIMTPHPRTVSPDSPVEDALRIMRVSGVRRLPVVDDDGAVLGLVSFDDIFLLLAAKLTEVGALCRNSDAMVSGRGGHPVIARRPARRVGPPDRIDGR